MIDLIISFLQGNESTFDDVELESIDLLANCISHQGLTTHCYKIISKEKRNQPLIDKLKSHYLFLSIHNAQIFESYRVLVEELVANKIEYIPLKGVFLLPLFYKDTAGRNISDIDLLIHPKEYERVQKLLLKLGAIQVSEGETALLQDLGHHYPPFILFNTSIEIHARILPKNMKYQIDVEKIWKEKEIYKLNNSELVGINKNQLLAYLALHIHYSEMQGKYRLYWYLDVYKLLEGEKKYLSDDFLTLIKEERIEKPVLKIISKVAYLFSLIIPRVNSLSPSEIKQFVGLLGGGDESSSNKGYSIVFERFLYTKGIFNRYLFIRDTVMHKKQNDVGKGMHLRLLKLLKNSFNYLVRSRR